MMKFTEEEKTRLKETNNQYLIGRLSTSRYREDYPPIVEKRQPVSQMKNSDSVAYFIELISLEPKEFDDNFNNYFSSDFFIGIDFCTHPKFLPKNYKKLTSIKQKESALFRHLSDKLIVFKPKINFKGEYAYKNLELVALIEDDKINKKHSFTPCPICLDDDALCKGKEIYLPKNPHSEKFQSIIFSDNSVYLGRWTPVKNKENYWIAEKNKKRPIVRFGLDELLAFTFNTTKTDLEKFIIHKNIFVNIDNHTCFFYTPLIKSIDEYISYRGGTCKNMAVFSMHREFIFNISEYCLVKETDERIREFLQSNSNENEVEEIKEAKEIEQTKTEEIVVEEVNTEIIKEYNNIVKEEKKVKVNRSEIKSESIYLNHLTNTIESQNLSFDNNDILNIYTSLKTSNLTLISGISGIGKLKLIKSFAKSLGLSVEENTLSIVQIDPSYNDISDLLGFYNAANNKYVPAETNLIDVLVNAHNNKDQMHMIVFNEMNLAKIENYFSQFLSLLDLEEKDRLINLYNENIDCLNSNLYPSKIQLANNILFVGTINTNDNGKELSGRILDKVNLIDLSKKTFLSIRDINKKSKPIDSYISSHVFNKFKNKKDNYIDIYTDKELVLFDKLHELISNANKDNGISYKTLSNIAEYLTNIPKNSLGKPMIDKNKTLDMQVKQRILTKIKGSEKEYRNLLGTCNSISGEIKDSSLYDFFDTSLATEISSFEETKKDIIRKSKELDLYGYTE